MGGAVAAVAPRWRIGETPHDLSTRALVMGVLNVTPDSFYDGGRFLDPACAVQRALAMVEEGADLVDVGGESTRPGADDVEPSRQLERIEPVVAALAAAGVVVSVDTRDAGVAERMLDLGASVINDISGLSDEGMASLAARRGASLVVMHMKGTPRTMQSDPRYNDVVEDVAAHLAERVARAEAAGVERDRIAVDPGIGFGKTPSDNLRLLAAADRFRGLAACVLLGLSRKSFLGAVGAGAGPADRLAGTLAVTALAYERGARVFRTHDPGETVKALAACRAMIADGGAIR